MNTLKRLVTGLVFAATVALALNVSSGDAYARMKSEAGSSMLHGTGGITVDLTTPADAFHVSGITWE